MDVRQLSALVAIADHGTFSAAARALFTVQSNVSSHIARLERELGTTLVNRAQGGLTDDGQRVVERARRILRELDEIASDVAPVDGQVTGDVRVGILGTTARWLLPRLLAALEVRHPNVRAIVSEGSTSVLIPSLLGGRFNGAIVHLPVDDPELVLEPLFAEDLVVVAHSEHPLARATELPLAEVASHRLLLPPPGAALRRVLDRAAGSVGVQLRAQAEIDGVRLLASLASDGHGAAIVPATAVSPYAAGRFAVVRVPELPPRVVALAHQRRPAPSAPSRALFDVLRDVLADGALQQPGVRVGSAAFPLSKAV
jgi:molybdate transport repressor ModE-like protein